MKKLLNYAVLLALAFVTAPALATGFGLGLQGWTGKVEAGASSVSTGGSMSETAAADNGFAANATLNATGGEAKAWGSVNHQGVQTGTYQSSFSGGASGSVKYGNATSQTAGGQGTDVNSASYGSFKTGGYGGYLGWGH